MGLHGQDSLPQDRPEQVPPRRGDVTWSRPGQAVVLFLRGRTAGTAVPTSAVVGTLLSSVNQGHVIAGGHAAGLTWVQVAFNYAVPYVVASVGYLSARRVRPERPPH